jgi:hypothetical protein
MAKGLGILRKLLTVLWAGAICAGVPVGWAAATQDWTKQLLPGATRADVYALIGQPPPRSELPTARHGYDNACEYYILDRIYACRYDGAEVSAELVDCSSYSSPEMVGTTVSSEHYFRSGKREGPNPAVEKFIQEGRFEHWPRLQRVTSYRGGRYLGLKYRVSNGFLVLVPFYIGTDDELSFANTNRVVALLSDQGEYRVIYDIKDHWEQFRPKQLDDATMADRERLLRTVASSKIGTKWDWFLGDPDGFEWSNIRLSLYYFRHGLVEVGVIEENDPSGASTLDLVRIRDLESGQRVDLRDWLRLKTINENP